MQKIEQIRIYNEKELDEIHLNLCPGDRVFFYGDLGAGKTSLIRSLLRRHLSDPNLIVRSPTYTYYSRFQLPDNNVVTSKSLQPPGSNLELGTCNLEPTTAIYHFDLYRVESVSTFSLIGGDEIWEDTTNICLIEWPERLENMYIPTKIVRIEKGEGDERKIAIEYI